VGFCSVILRELRSRYGDITGSKLYLCLLCFDLFSLSVVSVLMYQVVVVLYQICNVNSNVFITSHCYSSQSFILISIMLSVETLYF
jgi:hypothetical protein